MTITTNYTKSDWKRFIPSMIIQLLPSLFFALTVIWLYIPFLDDWVAWMDFNNEVESFGMFAEYVKEHELMKSPDEFVMFMFLTLFGSALFPVAIIVMGYKIFGGYIELVIRALKIEPRMKLVVFKNGHPVRKIRDLFK